MTPKEKAKRLLERMTVDMAIDKWQSKQCALIAVDEIISATGDHTASYWEQVREEIEKL